MSDEPRVYGVRVEVESDLCERGKWVAKWLSYVATGVSPESAVHTLRKRLKATTGIQHINDIRAMHAELTRLRALTEGFVCYQCGVAFSVDADHEQCQDAHRDTWDHEWVSRRLGDALNRALRDEIELDALRQAVVGLVNRWKGDANDAIRECAAELAKTALAGMEKAMRNEQEKSE